MLVHTVKLPSELHDFVSVKVQSGQYSSASELMQAALSALAREEQGREARRAASRTPAAEYDYHSIRESDVFRKLWQAHQSPNESRATRSGHRHDERLFH